MKRTVTSLVFFSFCLITELSAQNNSHNKEVDLLLRELSQKKTRAAAIVKFKALGSKAQTRLLFHIDNQTKIWSLMSLDACRYIWTEDIKKSCLKVTQYKDEKFATLAMVALIKNVPFNTLCKICDPILHRMHPSCGNIIFITLQSSTPSKKRVLRLANNKGYWNSVALYLCNYRGQKINRTTRIFLAKGDEKIKVQALNGLIFQADTAANVKKYILKLLHSKHAPLRERSAEYMRWYGESNDLTSLLKASKSEDDLYTKASLNAAINAIKSRKIIFNFDKSTSEKITTSPKDLKTFYNDAVTNMTKSQTTSQRKALIKSIYKISSEEPHYAYGSAKRIDQTLTKSQYKMFRLLAGYTSLNMLDEQLKKTVIQTPKTFFTVPPIPDYFDPKRKSFGKLIPPNSGPFSESHHVGDDCGWFLALTPVVSITDGVVRYVSHTISWGGIIIIEHKNTKGKYFCSLYAHLGPLIIVKPGDTVKAGDKIAALGRSNSWENGGYKAHLHFGIYNNAFSDKWICGYISRKLFASRNHQWLDPQLFIKKHLKN